MRQDITDLQAVYDGRYSCEENVYRGGLWDNEQEEYETGEREQSQMRRIVLLENPDAVDLVPKGCGISKILGLDPTDLRGFRVLKSYSVQDSWNKFAD